MRLSTHAGLSLRPFAPTSVGKSWPPRVCVGPGPFSSRAVGVGQLRTVASVSVVPACRPLSVEYPAAPEAFASPDVGVGQSFTAIPSGVPIPLPLIPLAFTRFRLTSKVSGVSSMFDAEASGVGHRPRDDEDALTAVRGADVGSADRMPFRIVPERGKRPENSVKTPGPKARHVLHHDNCGSHIANDAGVFPPET